MISRYFDNIKSVIESYNYIIESIHIQEKTYSDEKGFIEGKILFIDNSRLEFAEVKNIEITEKIKYHYHFMDSSNQMIFRCDNAKHHKEIKTFPHHKHLNNTVLESNEPTIKSILSEIEGIVISNED